MNGLSKLEFIIFASLLFFACGKKVETPEDKFNALQKPEKEKIDGIYFMYVTGITDYMATGSDQFYHSELQNEVKFLGDSINDDIGVFSCVKIDLSSKLVKIFLPIQKESFTYPISGEYELNKYHTNEANYVITMKTPLTEVKFTVSPKNDISFPFGRIWRKDKYNDRDLKSEEDCKEFSLKILDSCKVQRKSGEYFISELGGGDIRKDPTIDGEIITHLPLNAKVYTDEYATSWNKSDVSWKKVKYDGGEGFINSIHLEKTPSNCYDSSISAKRILMANADWGGAYFYGKRIIYAREKDSGGLDFEISKIEWEDKSNIESYDFLSNSLKLKVNEIRVFEGDETDNFKYWVEIPYSRFHMITPWNRVVDYDFNSIRTNK